MMDLEQIGNAAVRVRRIARENPRGRLSLALAPMSLGLMILAIRVATGANATRSTIAFFAALAMWAIVEYGAQWATAKASDDWPGMYGFKCEPMGEWLDLCIWEDGVGCGEHQIAITQASVCRCTGEDCNLATGECAAPIALKIGTIEIGRGPWGELRMSEAAQEFLRVGGPEAERIMRALDRAKGIGSDSHNDAEIN